MKILPMLAVASLLSAALLHPAHADSDPRISAGQGNPISNQSADREKQRHQAEANLSVLAFAKNKPPLVFEHVRNTMADVIDVAAARGVFLSLSRSYAISVYLHYNITSENYTEYGLSNEDYKYLMSDDATRISPPFESGGKQLNYY